MRKLILFIVLISTLPGFSQMSEFYYRQKTTQSIDLTSGLAIYKLVMIGDTVPFMFKSTRFLPAATALRTAIANKWLVPDTSVTSGSGSGTVTSIATTSPLTGGTITSTGTIAILPDTLIDWRLKQNKGAAAYGWGNHANLYWLLTDTNDYKKLASYYWTVQQLAGKQVSLGFTPVNKADSVNPTAGSYATNYDLITGLAGKVNFTEVLTLAGGGLDSTQQLLAGFNKMFMGYSSGMTIDAIILVGYGTAVNVTVKVKYSASMADTGYTIVYAGNALTVANVPIEVSSFNRTTIPKGNLIWFQLSAVTTKCRWITVLIKGHRL